MRENYPHFVHEKTEAQERGALLSIGPSQAFSDCLPLPGHSCVLK